MSDPETRVVDRPVLMLAAFLGVGAGLYFLVQTFRGLADHRLAEAAAGLVALVLIGGTLIGLGGASASSPERLTTRGNRRQGGETDD